MTLLGKVFTGLIFLLSVIFFSLSVAVNASHINQKQRADDFEKKAQDARNDNTQLTALLDEMKTELAIEQTARRAALASLQTLLGQTQSELQMQEAQLANLQAAHTVAVQTAQATTQELKAKTDDNELLRQQLVDARQDRNQLFARLSQTRDEIARLQGAYESLKLREDAIASDYTKAKEILETLDVGPDTMVTAPPPVNGQVLAVDNRMVEVSLGRDDGMREGFTLEVHRSGQYLGRLVVRTVRDDKSVAEILPSFQKGYIRPGDRVDSKLF